MGASMGETVAEEGDSKLEFRGGLVPRRSRLGRWEYGAQPCP